MTIPKFFLDKEGAAEVFKRLVEAYENKEKIFSWPNIFPQERFTRYFPSDSLEFRLLLFLVVNFDHSVQSSTYYRKVAESIDKGIFSNPLEILDYNLDQIKKLHKAWATPFGRYIQKMQKNIRVLKEKYDSDPLNVIKGENDINKAKEKFREFDEYGPNLSALLMTFYLKYGIVSFPNQKELEIKLDLNKLRVMYDTGIINPVEEYAMGRINKGRIIPKLKNFLCDLCKEHDLDTNIVSEAMWPIGERISSNFKDNLGKRKLNYLMNSPLAKFSDHTKYLDLPYGRDTVMKLKKRGIDVRGGFCYFQILTNPQRVLEIKH